MFGGTKTNCLWPTNHSTRPSWPVRASVHGSLWKVRFRPLGTERSSQGQTCGVARPKGGRASVPADPPSQTLAGPAGGIRVAAILAPLHPTSKGAARGGLGQGLGGGPEELRPRRRQQVRSGLPEAAAICVKVRLGCRSSQLLQSGPCQWAATARALGLCRSQPATCPQAPKFTHRPHTAGPGGLWGLWARCFSHLALCWNSKTNIFICNSELLEDTHIHVFP